MRRKKSGSDSGERDAWVCTNFNVKPLFALYNVQKCFQRKRGVCLWLVIIIILRSVITAICHGAGHHHLMGLKSPTRCHYYPRYLGVPHPLCTEASLSLLYHRINWGERSESLPSDER